MGNAQRAASGLETEEDVVSHILHVKYDAGVI